MGSKKQKKQKKDDTWAKGWAKFKTGPGLVAMNNAVRLYEKWSLENAHADASETNAFLKTLCKV